MTRLPPLFAWKRRREMGYIIIREIITVRLTYEYFGRQMNKPRIRDESKRQNEDKK